MGPALNGRLGYYLVNPYSSIADAERAVKELMVTQKVGGEEEKWVEGCRDLEMEQCQRDPS